MKRSVFFAICISLFSNLSFADWISDVDKKYQGNSPAIYAKVAQAQKLITDAKGNGDMNSQAYTLLLSVLGSNPKFAPAYVQMARLASNVGLLPNNQFDGSLLQSQEQFLVKALELEPNYDYAIALMGYTKMFQGELDEAGKYYEKAVKMGSGYVYLPMQLAQLESKRGNYSKALELAKQAYEKNKSEPKLAAGAITEILFASQRMPGDNTQEEDQWFAKRIELDPSAWNWQSYANFKLYGLGDYEKAIEYGEKALSIMDFGVGRYTLAAALYAKWATLKDTPARKVEAEQCFENAKKLYPDTSEMIRKLMVSPRLRHIGDELQKRLYS